MNRAIIRKSMTVAVVAISALLAAGAVRAQSNETEPRRDPKQAIDEGYTAKIKKYTTRPFFGSALVDYLPASKNVPTPEVVLGDVAGAPGILPYSSEVYKYFRMLEKATPRVKVFSIGTTEEGREMIAVAVSSEENLSHMQENQIRLGRLADPRLIKFDDAEADKLVEQAVPIYYITGTIHSTETGAPTALMEMAYRLAVDESPYIREIRDRVITLITPIVEVDGRDRIVDIYRWHLAHPKDNWPSLVYWGHYVAHDNNRDAMGVTLKLTENVLNTFVSFKAQVLHDLHESVPYLYDNTAGDGPFNAWVDPILTNEWEMLGWRNVADMTKLGMPGVFTHGVFDTWSPGYLMFIAAMHNGISRLYETFGNGGADTLERTLTPNEYDRTWYRQDPPLPKTTWSQRDNNNYEETGLLTALHYFGDSRKFFLKNFYLKAKRSIQKPAQEGPAAYVLPGDDSRPGTQADLLRVLQKQKVEISRATAPFTVTLPAPRTPGGRGGGRGQGGNGGDNTAGGAGNNGRAGQQAAGPPAVQQPATITREFPAGSYIIRMDQPYSRIADSLLDYQYWAPDDPQRTPYDDTGWTFGELFNVQVVRVPDVKVLDAAMQPVTQIRAPGGVTGTGSVFAINHNADPALATLRYRLKGATVDAAEESFDAVGHKFNRGSFLISGVSASDLQTAATELGVQVFALDAAPSGVKTHPVRAARVALLHTWQSTQTEGWWREALDNLKIPYDYISTQTVGREANLNSKYDVILFPPGAGSPTGIIKGQPTDWGNPLPWKKTAETPNLLVSDNDWTDDTRPGMGWEGFEHLQDFVRKGGVLVAVEDTANFASAMGMLDGVSVSNGARERIIGSVVKTRIVDDASPIAYGYGDTLSAYCDNGLVFGVSNVAGRRGGGRRLGPDMTARPTGRGTQNDLDFVPGRQQDIPPVLPTFQAWEAAPVTDEQLRNNIGLIPPALRPRVVFRYSATSDLLVSGLVENGGDIAEHPAVVDSPEGSGHIVLFSTNPIYRGETEGNYFLVFNAILNFDNLNAGRKLADK
ncbi:MAG: M14 family zinc carboxypeptidase [Candidatus Acidiferrales bacterium]